MMGSIVVPARLESPHVPEHEGCAGAHVVPPRSTGGDHGPWAPPLLISPAHRLAGRVGGPFPG
jgi:hypothetical protein